MTNEFRNNHYVPEWYQKRFISSGQVDQELFYLHLKPESVIDSQGRLHQKKAVYRRGVNHCFVEPDLYTTQFGEEISTKIEQYFFGDIDRNGRSAVEYFTNFSHPSVDYEAFQNMVLYLSTQKLRTPKGLAWLSSQSRTTDKQAVLSLMLRLRGLYSAIWSECIWQIADASLSDTKFIVSDHPVTIYNRKLGPRNAHWCRGFNDPDIRFHGSHTLFPLTLDKILILTNLSWVRNPHQSEIGMRPNPAYIRQAMFNFTEIQTLRHLSEQEVRQINFIIKSRAYKYIGAGKKEWLYPEEYVSKSDWNTYGHGYLLMPDPRGVDYHTEIMWGNDSGVTGAIDSYGRTPIHPDYKQESKNSNDFNTFYKFKGEFARLFGSARRGRAFNVGQLDNERDSDEFHSYHLSLELKKNS